MAEQAKVRRSFVDCVDCGGQITLTGGVKMGQEVTCPECGAMMEVVGLNPVEVDWIYDDPEYDEQEEEDW